MEGAAGVAGELHHLFVRFECARAVTAVVRAVVAPVAGHHPAELGEFGVLRVHPGGVGQAGRHADRALPHPLVHQLLHPGQFGVGGGAVLPADGVHPYRALRDEVGGVHGDALAAEVAVQAVQVAADRAPVEVDVGAVTVPAGDGAADLGQRAVVRRRVRQAVLAQHFERDALCRLRAVVRVAQQRQITVGVHVDESGGQCEAVRVDRAGGGGAGAGGALAVDLGDPAAVDRHIGAVGRLAGAVDNERVAQDQVHGSPFGG
ncbi:hypothetical protein SMICM17S_12212 [Streptomyces microflavus]